jgi:signal transducing adaptor molecule
MDVCDKVSNEESGAKDAVASMIKRLAHRNANVQLYTLEVGLSPVLLYQSPLISASTAR